MDTKQPLVSIIIPTYNRAHLIGETLDSILSQTYQNWECIVVDDGSTDDTAALMQGYCNKDPRFQYHHRPKDRPSGGNAARNYGFEVSKGEYIQWFDSDDIMMPELLFKKITLFSISETSLDFILCGLQYFNGKNNRLRIYDHEYIPDLLHTFLQDKVVLNTQVFLFKKELVKNIRYRETLTRAQDLDFIFNVLKKMPKGYNSKEALLKIRVHENSITGAFINEKFQDIESELQVRKEIVDYFSIKKGKNFKIALGYYLVHVRKAFKIHWKYGFKQLNTLTSLSFLDKLQYCFIIYVANHSYRGNQYFKNMIKKLQYG